MACPRQRQEFRLVFTNFSRYHNDAREADMATPSALPRRAAAALAVTAIVAAATPVAAYPRPGRLELVSMDSAGNQANHHFGFSSDKPLLTPDARYVVYYSSADNLVPGDTNEDADVFVFDRVARTTERVSLTSDGQEAPNKEHNTNSFPYSVTPDGRFVSFDTNGNFDPRDDGWRDAYVRDRETGATELLSVSTTGVKGNNDSYAPFLSAEARYAVFDSGASNLVAGDTNGFSDVFLRDRDSGTTQRISVTPDGGQSNGGSGYSAITPDGRHVLFSSGANNLVADDLNGAVDTFVRNLETGTTELVSLSSAEGQGAAAAQGVSITPDGRFVVFVSFANNFVPEDTNGDYDLFVRDRLRGTTERVTVSSDGAETFGYTFGGTISPDGRYVAFYSDADTLVEGDTNGQRDQFVRDLLSRTTELVSVSADGTQGNGMSWAVPGISADGRYVAFMSHSTNFLAHDANGEAGDIFVRDRGPRVGALHLAAREVDGEIEVTGEATFSGAVLAAADDVAGDAELPTPAGDLRYAHVVYRPEREDLHLRLGVERLAAAALPPRCSSGVCTPTLAGHPGLVHGFTLTVGGVRYEARALRAAVTADPPAVPLFALFRCTEACEETVRLAGGYGTAGEEISLSIPLSALGVVEGDTVSGLRAFTAVGEAAASQLQPLDDLSLDDVSVPARRVFVGVGGTEPPSSFPVQVVPEQASFSARVPPASLPVEPRAWVRVCLGDDCASSSGPIS